MLPTIPAAHVRDVRDLCALLRILCFIDDEGPQLYNTPNKSNPSTIFTHVKPPTGCSKCSSRARTPRSGQRGTTIQSITHGTQIRRWSFRRQPRGGPNPPKSPPSQTSRSKRPAGPGGLQRKKIRYTDSFKLICRHMPHHCPQNFPTT